MEISTQTEQDARSRVVIGMMGCLANKPTREYLIALRRKLLGTIARIEEELAKL